jgi:hypothetical protein
MTMQMHFSRTLLRIGAVAVHLAVAACGTKATAPAASPSVSTPPDLSGVWQIATPVTQLLTTDGKRPPLTAAALKVYETRIAASKAGDTSWDSSLRCKPPGEPRSLFDMGWPFQIGQGTERVSFMFQWNRYVRVVEMGLKLADFSGPYFYGKSTGKWAGDTLVVDMNSMREEVSLDSAGMPHTEDLKLNERFRLITGGKQLEARLQFDDPATFTQAWETVLVFNRMPDTAIVEDNCLDRLKLPNSYRPTLDAAAK